MLNLSSDEMEALVEHREKLDAELEQLRENRMELEAEIEGKENALNIIDKIRGDGGELLMKNGKAPTREQKKIMKAHGLVPENWLVVKNLPDSLEVVSRVSLKKVGGKPKTRTISKSL